MDPSEFPPNNAASKVGKEKRSEDKTITQVTTGAVRKKRSLRKQFSETFVGGDLRSSVSYVMLEVLLPGARDMVFEAVSEGFSKLIFGDSRRGKGRLTGQYSDTLPRTQYQHYSMGASTRTTGPQRAMSRQARARHDFDEIVIPTREEAEEVIDQLFELVANYDVATVADLYELTGLDSTHTDHKWGWVDLKGAGAARVRGGYLLDLPDPGPIE